MQKARELLTKEIPIENRKTEKAGIIFDQDGTYWQVRCADISIGQDDSRCYLFGIRNERDGPEEFCECSVKESPIDLGGGWILLAIEEDPLHARWVLRRMRTRKECDPLCALTPLGELLPPGHRLKLLL